jgi:DNA-directed RNA polymerase subunit alpha
MSADDNDATHDVAADTHSATLVQDDPATAPKPPPFDLLGVQSPSFAVLEEGRAQVYASQRSLDAFRRSVHALKDSGEEGRRKGLGLWMVADYDACAAQLGGYESDDVAAYTRGRALASTGRHDEAAPIFERLAKAYPEEPRPRAAHLLALLEDGFAKGVDVEALGKDLRKALDAAQAGFFESVEGRYVSGRVAEATRDLERALDEYCAGYAIEARHLENSFHGGLLAERAGHDDLAIKFYEALIHTRPIDERALINLGILYEDVGRDQDAAACYDVVVANRPTDRRARLYLADAQAGMEMYYDEDMERKEDRLNQILRIPITDFELSVRARNCLNKMQIQSLGDLVCRTEQELLSYKNFGETSLTEIKEILHSKGLRLGMPRDEAVASIEAHSRRSSGSGASDVMNKPIMDLQLSIRARRTVEALGCLTAGDITKHSVEELLGMPNFGQTSLQELRSTLAELGLKLKGE